MNLSSLKPAKGSTHNSKRVGRGQGSGKGGTSTKGHKGAQSRSGYSRKIGFEGGQMPLQRRIPKRGFKNVNRVEYAVINLAMIQHYAEKFNVDTIDLEFLRKNNFIKKSEILKVLANGELKSKVNVSAHAISATALAQLESVGGTFTKL
ncbi:MAG: 50S ribosomal protein L15 [Chitinophagales bacterium]|nr:50S ribosomal protein L15 [Chitinophagales bacterium]